MHEETHSQISSLFARKAKQYTETEQTRYHAYVFVLYLAPIVHLVYFVFVHLLNINVCHRVQYIVEQKDCIITLMMNYYARNKKHTHALNKSFVQFAQSESTKAKKKKDNEPKIIE